MYLLRHFSRILAGIVFLFSGVVKAVDPLGTAYKFGDYFIAMGIPWMIQFSLVLAFLMIAAEFIIGWLLLFNVKTQINAWFVLGFMVLFTPVTLWLAITNAVDDCGCFGDFIHLSNWETFYKNLVILLFVLIMFFYRDRFKSFGGGLRQLTIGLAGTLLVTWIMVDAYRNLPRFDFRPFHKGANLAEDMLPVPEIAEILLVYKHGETGEELKFTTQNLPYQDTVLWPLIKDNFVRQEKGTVYQEFRPAKTDFIILGPDGEDLSEEILKQQGFSFLILMYDIDKVRDRTFQKFLPLIAQAEERDIPVRVITGSRYEEVEAYLGRMGAPLPHYSSDVTKIKTVIRSNPGLMLLHNGFIIDKWHHNNVPDLENYNLTAPIDAFLER